MEVADLEEEDAKDPEKDDMEESAPVAGFAMKDSTPEFAVVQATKMAK